MPPPGTRIRSITGGSRKAHSHLAIDENSDHEPPSFHDNDDKRHVLDTHDRSTLVLFHDRPEFLSAITEVDKKTEENKETPCCGTRHVLAFLAFLGFFNVYCMRANLSVALVRMVNSTQGDNSSTTNSNSECFDSKGGNSSSSHSTGEFSWDEQTQGYVLGAFFYGYIITQLPGGWLASRFGGKNLLGLGVLFTAMLTIITPFAARSSVYLLIAVRVLEGFGEGVTFPAMHAIWGEWAPVMERSKLVSFTYAGAQLGTVFSLPVSGLLCDSGLLGGWPLVFYVFGALGCVWFVVWMLLVHDTPAKHPRISVGEREYIQRSVGFKEHQATPWRSIITSSAVWGTAAGHFANNWGLYTLLTCMPTYMKSILKFDIKENGFLSAVPYAVCWTMQNISGLAADFLRSHGYLSTSKTRKLFNTLGTVLPAVLLVIVGYVGCDRILAVVFLSLSVGIGGCTMAGYNVNHLDIAPNFAGILMGLTNTVATIPGFVGPAIVGYLTNHNETRHQWLIVFYITAGIYFAGAILFAIFAKGEELPWSKSMSEKIVNHVINSSLEDSTNSEVYFNRDSPNLHM